jgi:hypothetical protein
LTPSEPFATFVVSLSESPNQFCAARELSAKKRRVVTQIPIFQLRRSSSSLRPRWCELSRVAGYIGGILVIFTSVGAAVAGQPQNFTDSLAAIRSVGPEGRGNAEAAVAWKNLAGGDANTLVPILAGMDGANDFAVNWLRAAVDSIAARVSSAGGTLPLADLGMFLLDTRHNPRARRLSFELLMKADPATTEKLLSGMLNDPSLELRYDAVQKVIDQADHSLAASNKLGATLLLQQALHSARDVGQIDDISKKLDELGQPVDSLKLFGFLTHWKIIAPFDNTGRKGFDAVYPPEQKIDLDAEYDGKTGKVKWRDYIVTDKFGKVDMNQAYGKLKEVTAYATTDFYSDRAQSVELRLGGENSWKVWLNGKLLFGRNEYHFASEIDQYPIAAQLQPGRNTILVKFCQNEQTEDWTVDWNFQLRVTDSIGTPILSAAAGGNSGSTIERP